MSQKIHITIHDDIKPEIALLRIATVVSEGRISKDNTKYCWLTVFSDDIAVAVNDYRKSDCFVVYKDKRNEQL